MTRRTFSAMNVALVVLAITGLRTAPLAAEPLASTPNPQGLRHVITRPDVLSPPSQDVLAKAYPVQALGPRIEGEVQLRCRVAFTGDLVDCAVDQESPQGYGFGDAALKLAPAYRMRPETVDGVAVDTGLVVVPIRFRAPQLPTAGTWPTRIDVFPTANPAFDCANAPNRYASYYPSRAQHLGVEGTAQIACKVDSVTGKVEACTWTEENPPNFGFGLAAEKLGCLVKLGPAVGQPEEVILSMPMRFKVPSR